MVTQLITGMDIEGKVATIKDHSMPQINVYGMYTQNSDKAGFWVRRDSWSATSFAQVKAIAGAEHGPLTGKAPYYERQKVSMDFYLNGQLHEPNAELSCPGTYAYTLITDPREEHQPKWAGSTEPNGEASS